MKINKKNEIAINIKIIGIVFVISIINSVFYILLNSVQAALYQNKGDNIPYSEVKYDANDAEFTYFPESYRENLKALKSKHPNWTFMAVYTNLDFYDSIAHESYEKGSSSYISTVPSSYSAIWKKDGQNNYVNGDSSWVIASKSAVGYCLDPRNWLSESYIFQFEVLNWAKLSKNDLETAMKYLLPNMYASKTYIDTEGKEVTMEKSYVDIIYEAGEQNDVNPLSIITKIKQEVGDFGTDGSKNSSVSGTVSGFTGYYNFFNVNATDGVNAIKYGLAYAKKCGWDTPEKSIKAGAATLYNDYIKYGQNTLYNQKFDVTNIYKNAIYLYAWQYMTNILDPGTQAQNIYNSYSKMGIIDSEFVFYIPVFENMPSSASGLESNVDVKYEQKEESVKVINCDNTTLNVRNGISTDSKVITSIKNGENLTRLGIYSNGFAKVRLPDGMVGYVKNEFLEVVTSSSDNIYVTKLELDKDLYELEVGQELKYNLTITPANATNKDYTVTSSNDEILKIDGGKVVAQKEGEATITFKINNNSENEVDIYEQEKEIKTSATVKVSKNIKNYEIDTSKIIIEGDLIKKLPLQTNLGSVKSSIKLYNGCTILAKDVSGDVLNDESNLGTGTDISIIDSKNKLLVTYKVIIKGDVNGDAKSTAADYVLVKNHIMGSAILGDIQSLGADANGDGKVSAADYVLIKNHIMNGTQIDN